MGQDRALWIVIGGIAGISAICVVVGAAIEPPRRRHAESKAYGEPESRGRNPERAADDDVKPEDNPKLTCQERMQDATDAWCRGQIRRVFEERKASDVYVGASNVRAEIFGNWCQARWKGTVEYSFKGKEKKREFECAYHTMQGNFIWVDRVNIRCLGDPECSEPH